MCGRTVERVQRRHNMRTEGIAARGWLAERMTLKALVEACLVLEDGGAGIKDIDACMMAGARTPFGPFALADMQGLDVALDALERARRRWGEHFEPPRILR